MSIVVDDASIDRVRVVAISNPCRGNALTKNMIAELARAFDECPSNVVGVILKGDFASDSFCTGIDLRHAADVFAMANDERDVRDPSMAIAEFQRPIACVAHGKAINAGLELALACDVVVASACASFEDTHSAIGIAPSWGLSVNLPNNVGVMNAKAMSAFGEVVSGTRAAAIGLAWRCERTKEEAFGRCVEMMERVKANAENGSVVSKRCIDEGMDLGAKRAKERSRAFEQYREEATARFEAYGRRRRSKL